jgi:Leucine-rich repeat (LRR) protein
VPLATGRIQNLLMTGLTPGTTYYFAMKSSDDHGNWSDISDCPHASCLPREVVSFPDAALEQAIREHVHRPAGDLHTSDVDTILHFTAAEAGIVSLSGMQCCSSLQTAQFGGNSITDLMPLTYLYNLRGLYLNSNQVSNLGPLVNLTSLGQLHLIGNPVTNLLPVSYLFSLQQLTLSGTEIADYTPLYGLGHLADLYLGGMNLVNIDFNHIYSAEALRGLVTLESLSLMHNEIVDLAPLTGLVNLREVNLAKNRIADLQALLENTGLAAGDRLDLRENPLTANALSVQILALEARGVVVQR